jgi:general secretion pathway protein G
MRARGFTLLEVMIVLLVVGLLAALVGPQLFGRADEARQARAAADLAAFTHALERHRLDTGSYPTTEQGLAALAPRYLDVLPDDPWGHPYVYFRAADGRAAVRSFGADGVEGGSGAAADVEPYGLP